MDIKIDENLKKLPIEIIIVLGTLALYIIAKGLLTPSDKNTAIILVLISALVVIELVYFVWREMRDGVKKHGWKHEVIDTIIAIIVAVLLWLGISAILNTSTPISAVASCSMLPALERGTFIIVQGSDINAYDINMTPEELEYLSEGPFIAMTEERNFTLNMPLYVYCACHKSEPLCTNFENKPESVVEKAGPFTCHYGKCNVNLRSGVHGYGKCLEYVEFKGKRYYQNLSHDIIVYNPPKGDLYAMVGDIVHRVFFRINVDGKTYYLTKGDNNVIFDIQQLYCDTPELKNHPVPQQNVRGKVIGEVPYLGYLKLFIAGPSNWQEDEQCSWQINYTTVK